MKGIFIKFSLQYGKADPEIYFRVFYHLKYPLRENKHLKKYKVEFSRECTVNDFLNRQ